MLYEKKYPKFCVIRTWKIKSSKPIPCHTETNYPANIYLLEVNNGNTRKDVNYVQG